MLHLEIVSGCIMTLLEWKIYLKPMCICGLVKAGQTSLHHAAEDGDVAELQRILSTGVSVDSQDKVSAFDAHL